jgi:hypothetical protein
MVTLLLLLLMLLLLLSLWLKGWVVLGAVDLDQYVEDTVHTAQEFDVNFRALKARRKDAEKVTLHQHILYSYYTSSTFFALDQTLLAALFCHH